MSDHLDEDLRGFLARMAQPRPSPAGGAAVGVAAAMAAALLEKACLLTRDGSLASFVPEAEEHRQAALRFVGEDEQAFGGIGAVRREGGDVAAAWRSAALVPLAFAERCATLAELAADVATRCNENLAGDARTAALLAASCAESAALLADIDLDGAGGPSAEELDRLAAVRRRVAGR